MRTYWQWIHIFSGVARLETGFCFEWTKQVFYTIYLFSNFVVFKGNKFLVRSLSFYFFGVFAPLLICYPECTNSGKVKKDI